MTPCALPTSQVHSTHDSMHTNPTCPYCPRPLPDRIGAVTCGNRPCQQAHHRAFTLAAHHANRDAINARRRGDTGPIQLPHCRHCGDTLSVPQRRVCPKEECRREHQRQRDLRRRQPWLVPDRAAHTVMDLSAEQIEAKLARLAAQRKATRSWLRIEDPWQQRAGCALHQRSDVQTFDLEGAVR